MSLLQQFGEWCLEKQIAVLYDAIVIIIINRNWIISLTNFNAQFFIH